MARRPGVTHIRRTTPPGRLTRHRELPAPPPGVNQAAEAMSEDDLMRRIQRLCRDLGLLAYHTHDSRGSAPGYPDWHIVGRARSLFRECKTEAGKTTKEQDEWISRLLAVGYDVDVWRPRDLFNGRIQRELIAIARIPIRSDSA